MTRADLVSVIIPAWNAETTIGATLRSVQRQTHRDLEIIIVDDGSTDGTAAVAAEFCRFEPRARLIRREHEGVAKARNHAIDESAGAYIAPIDADDVWHPEKIERQFQLLAASPARVGLAYNWFRKMDDAGKVVESSFRPRAEGQVLKQHLKSNFIANGSTPLFRRGALAGLRYEPALQASGNQGCEDYLLQLQIARRCEFACVPAFLTGYRMSPATMSTDGARMIRSHIQMYRILLPELTAEDRRVAERELAKWFAAHGLVLLRRGQVGEAAAGLAKAAAASPAAALMQSARMLVDRAGELAGAHRPVPAEPLAGVPFDDLAPDD